MSKPLDLARIANDYQRAHLDVVEAQARAIQAQERWEEVEWQFTGGERMKSLKFRKKPVEIEAMFWSKAMDDSYLSGLMRWLNDGGAQWQLAGDGAVLIHTLEGDMLANDGDWIIKGVKGEFYPCKPDIFEATYDAVASNGDSS